MVAIAAFWVLLSLPGYALLRRFRCPLLAYGGPSTLLFSYLSSFVLLTPVSVTAYVFRLPLAVLSGAIVLSASLALLWLVLVDRPSWRWRRPSWLSVLVSVLIIADAIAGLRSGTHTAGDAGYHIARIRMLLGYGFNNWDPLVPGQRFDALYHTNLYHALLAASAQLARLSAVEAWVYSWFFAKLLAAGAIYFLAFTVLGRSWLAWVAAGMFTVWMAASSVLPYPNSLAVCVLLPLAIGLCVEVVCQRRGMLPALGLCALALTAVQIHGLYYVMACVVVAPVLLARLIYLLLRRRSGARPLIVALLGLGLGIPWLGVTIMQRGLPSNVTINAVRASAGDGGGSEQLQGLDSGFIRLPNGLIMFDPAGLWDVTSQRFQLLVAIAAGLCSKRRRQFAAFAGVILVVLTVLYVPWVCTALARAAGAPWIIKRFVALQAIGHHAVFPGAFLLLVPARFAGTWLQILALVIAFGHAYVSGVDDKPWRRKLYLRRALHHGRAGYLAEHAKRRALFAKAIPAGATVVIDPWLARGMVLDCDCYPLALSDQARGVDDMDQRRADVAALLDPRLELPARVAILRRYDVRYIVLQGRRSSVAELQKKYAPYIKKTRHTPELAIIELDLDRVPQQAEPGGAP